MNIHILYNFNLSLRTMMKTAGIYRILITYTSLEVKSMVVFVYHSIDGRSFSQKQEDLNLR